MPAAPPSNLLWLDPGGMTGFAWRFGDIFGAQEYTWDEACWQLATVCEYWGGLLHVGFERFTIRPNTHKLSPQPEAYEFPGVIKFLARKHGCRLLPSASPGERLLATPEMLKTLGWWPAGLDDAQSAAQHLLAWMMREGCVPHDLEIKLAQARS